MPSVGGVEYGPGQRAPRPGRVFQGVFDETGAHVVGDRPADQTPGAHVDDGGQIEELPLATGQVGDVAVKSAEVVYLPFDKTSSMTVSGTGTGPMVRLAHATS